MSVWLYQLRGNRTEEGEPILIIRSSPGALQDAQLDENTITSSTSSLLMAISYEKWEPTISETRLSNTAAGSHVRYLLSLHLKETTKLYQ